MAPSPPKCPPLNFTHSPDALPFTVSPPDYVKAHSNGRYSAIGTGALVFDTPSHTIDQNTSSRPRILLVQRAANDSMPNRWEVPGGGCDDVDESVLYSVARELWEEAGLKAVRFSGPVGQPHIFPTRSGRLVCRFCFVVDVETDNTEGMVRKEDVLLDPEEHQRFVWATEAEVRAGKMETEGGELGLEFTKEKLRAVILEAFEQLTGNGKDTSL